MNELDKAKDLLNNFSYDDENSFNENNDIRSFVNNLIKTNECATIAVKYENTCAIVTAIYPTVRKVHHFNSVSKDEYEDFCKSLEIDPDEYANCSRTNNICGVRTRVFAITKPFSATPIITISTTKNPPAMLNKQTISDDEWDKIVHSNFIVIGQSGSGKTYLMNYLLHKFIKDYERVALIEEFGEIIPPNENTVSMIVPPPKPGEESKLRFLTEQSNLMRLDAFYVGEIKGAEAWPFVVNLASGTRGGATIHGTDARQALQRLRSLCQLSCNNDEAIDEMISKSIQYIIVMKNKNIESIQELTTSHIRGNFSMREIYS